MKPNPTSSSNREGHSLSSKSKAIERPRRNHKSRQTRHPKTPKEPSLLQYSPWGPKEDRYAYLSQLTPLNEYLNDPSKKAPSSYEEASKLHVVHRLEALSDMIYDYDKPLKDSWEYECEENRQCCYEKDREETEMLKDAQNGSNGKSS